MESVEQYYREKDERWAIPDEDWDDYLRRRQQPQPSAMSGDNAFSSNAFEQRATPSRPILTRADIALQGNEGTTLAPRKHSSKRSGAEHEELNAQGEGHVVRKRRVENSASDLSQPALSKLDTSPQAPSLHSFEPEISPQVMEIPRVSTPPVAFIPTSTSHPTPSSPIDEVSNFTEPPRRRTPPHKRALLVETSTITTPGNPSIAPVPGPSRVHQSKAMRMRPPPPPPPDPAKVAKSKSKSRAKEKPPKRTPVQYARELAEKLVPSNRAPILKGFKIFYVGGDNNWATESTRKRMDYVHARGGVVVPEYDPAEVTHIVSATGERITLRTLGLKKLSDIPDDIPTVTWDWVLSATSVREPDGSMRTEMGHEFMYPSFAKRVPPVKNDTGPPKEKGKSKDDGGGGSSGEDASHAASSSKSVAARPSIPDDPLAEFEALARAERGAESIEAITGQNDTSSSINSKLKGFLCDLPADSAKADECANQDVIDKLTELAELHRAKPTEDDKWKVYTYTRAIRALRTYPHRITSQEQALSLKGVGEKTAMKIMEIINTGDLRRIAFERTEDAEVIKLLNGVYGVGQQIAYSWYRAGCRTLDDVRNRKGGIKLSSVQEFGLKFYEDINTRMPRTEARDIFEAIKPIALSLDPDLFIEIMGSYRRGKATCGDVDILMTRPKNDGKTHAGVLFALLERLHAVGILTEDLSIPSDFDDLECVYRGLCVRPLLPGEDASSKRVRRRIDILTVPWESRGAALIYYTGDDIFNRSLRLKAQKMGCSLNQRGLYKGVVRSPGDKTVKLHSGHIVASASEAEIFEVLGVPWQEPWERVRG